MNRKNAASPLYIVVLAVFERIFSVVIFWLICRFLGRRQVGVFLSFAPAAFGTGFFVVLLVYFVSFGMVIVAVIMRRLFMFAVVFLPFAFGVVVIDFFALCFVVSYPVYF